MSAESAVSVVTLRVCLNPCIDGKSPDSYDSVFGTVGMSIAVVTYVHNHHQRIIIGAILMLRTRRFLVVDCFAMSYPQQALIQALIIA